MATFWQAAGQGMQFLILGWLVLRITDSSAQMGLVIFLFGVPNFALLLFGGIVADRLDRRLMMMTTQSVVAVALFLLAFVEMADLVTLWHLYVVAFFLGTVQGLSMPARLAIVADLVDRKDIMNAVALISAVMNLGRIVGPALAGWIIDAAGIGPSLIFNASCYLVGTLLLGLIHVGATPRSAEPRTVLGDLAQGINYARSTAVAFSIIGMGWAFGFFAMASTQILPAFAKEFLETSASGAGLLISAVGLGSLLGSLALASLGDSPNKGRLLLGTAIIFIAALLLFAWSTWFWVSWVILLFAGAGSMGFISMGTTLLQLTAPTELHGRILSLWLLSAALNYIGALPLAVAADALSWPISIAGGSALFLLVVLWLGVRPPALRRLSV